MSPVLEANRRSLRELSANPWIVVGSIVAGLAIGKLSPELAGSLGIIGEVYIELLKMVVLPFMVAAVIFSMRKLFTDKASAHILPRILLTFLAAFCAAALAGLLAGILVAPGRDLSPDTLMGMGKLAGAGSFNSGHDNIALFGTEALAKTQSFSDIVMTLIPSNIFSALTQGEALKVLVFSLMFGLAVGKAPGRFADALTNALETVYRACLQLTHWFNLMLPLVLLAIVASQVAKTGLEPFQVMPKFLLALGLGSLLLVLLSLWALRIASRRPWPEVMQSQREPLLMAIATRSSTACMPIMITSLVETLGFARSRIELLVPLGISLLRIGPVIYYVVATMFIAQLYGVHLGILQLGLVGIGSMLAGFASSGMSGLVTLSLTGLVCNYLRLPFEAAMALFIAVDPLCDMLRTAVLVVGNNAFAAMAAGAPAAEEE